MTPHSMDIARATPPRMLTARCVCGWERRYVTDEEWSQTLASAQQHVASLCGGYQREDNGHTGVITVHAEQQ